VRRGAAFVRSRIQTEAQQSARSSRFIAVSVGHNDAIKSPSDGKSNLLMVVGHVMSTLRNNDNIITRRLCRRNYVSLETESF